ncbi:hypothetical protein JHK85_008976 [Glycine max]|uniref:Uncharacterized protein n=2 Tax=Glycine subgen. Soja TaxID=1462606 RepID=K7KHI4_SOYBN|nr:hypothetical protein JHK85_008976 [Glycine max]KAG5065003.1 hypothetical protein JHK86_008734 [Glycine max]KAH1109229.1 hypothetical protein GYH30_008573 [Glycine max]RZC14442.1 hypothetical protein D0Y65_008427 [Glycine soja]
MNEHHHIFIVNEGGEDERTILDDTLTYTRMQGLQKTREKCKYIIQINRSKWGRVMGYTKAKTVSQVGRTSRQF